jgi:hypothetical protein
MQLLDKKYDDILDFWKEKNLSSLNGDNDKQDVNICDLPFLRAKRKEQCDDKDKAEWSFKFDGRIPSPWDGNLVGAKFIICYANPAFHKDDKKLENKKIMKKQLSGRESLPTQIETWKGWYKKKKLHLLDDLDDSDKLCVFNICPYASVDMSKDVNWRVASGLPSVWMAQRHLRETLIPKALKHEIFLVIARAHRFWGVPYEGHNSSLEDNPFKSENLRIQTNIPGTIDQDIVEAFNVWKENKYPPKSNA